MSSEGLLDIQPSELKFTFESKKQSSCSLHLANKTGDYVAFKVKTTNPKKYCVRPNTGVVAPRSACDVTVTMQAQSEAPPDMRCKDRFLIQSVVTSQGATSKDINAETFTKGDGKIVEECKMEVVYVPPLQTPSSVPEEGSSPQASYQSDNRNLRSYLYDAVSKAADEPDTKNSEVTGFISILPIAYSCIMFNLFPALLCDVSSKLLLLEMLMWLES
ncbi:Vesicle-associated protein 1-3 [Nymphaea thermarum]|nr:Vesicle-associated protein 1-3 [Nymphaea thermarum]